MGDDAVQSRSNFAGLLMLPGLIAALRKDKDSNGPSVVSILRSIQEDEDPGRCIVRKCRNMLEPSGGSHNDSRPVVTNRLSDVAKQIELRVSEARLSSAASLMSRIVQIQEGSPEIRQPTTNETMMKLR
jgi:hypothetical protein